MMKTHFTEADLLETYYMQPGESMPVMMHLASCEECASRYDRLGRKLREAASCETERPATFWVRQRHLVMHAIAKRREHRVSIARTFRVAAVAAFAFILGTEIMYKSLDTKPLPNTPIQRAQLRPMTDDPWDSKELKTFHSVVEWENWIDSGDEL